MRLRTGNRCGHNPSQPRFCDNSRRGRGGHPPVITQMCAQLQQLYSNRSILSTWQNLNPSGRRRRSEIREAAITVGQFLLTQWFQLETNRCVFSGDLFLEVPTVEHLKNKISQSEHWQDSTISIGRINAVLSEWTAAGYITSKQRREKLKSGEWKCYPAIRTFTKKFFLELGGKKLWKKIKQAATKKLKKIQSCVDMLGITLKEYLNPGEILTPQQARQRRESNRKAAATYQTSKSDAAKVRASKAYKAVFVRKLFELFAAHPPDGPPGEAWSAAEIESNARRITDKQFKLA